MNALLESTTITLLMSKQAKWLSSPALRLNDCRPRLSCASATPLLAIGWRCMEYGRRGNA